MNPALLKSIHSKLTKEEINEIRQSLQFVTGWYADDVNEYLPSPKNQEKTINKWICLYEDTPLTHIFTSKSDAIDYSRAFEASGQGKRVAVVKVAITYGQGQGLDD